MLKIIFGLLLATNIFANEILPADKAFIPTAKVIDGNLVVDFAIEDGYYLYQNKINITPLDNTKLGEFTFSAAKEKDDEFFGRINVYRHSAKISTPILSSDDAINVEIGFQGCADAGVCYPPIKQKHTVIGEKTKVNTNKQNFFNSIMQQNELEDPVNVDNAFTFSADKLDGDKLKIGWKIRENYYLYADKFNFKISGADFAEIDFPKGKLKNDEFFGEVEIYDKDLEIIAPLNNISDKVKIDISYQGCWEEGVCYPPVNKTKEFDFNAPNGQTNQTTISQAPQQVITSDITKVEVELNEEDKIVNILKDSGFWVIVAIFFGIGLALTFTPCVLPMIPILSSIIVGQGDISKGRAFFLSLIFVLAMALTYTFAGVLAGLSGENLQIILQNPYVLVSFSIIFVALAFSMFGYFEIKLPNFLNNALTKISNKQQGGTVMGVAVMGLLSALIVGPCVAPPLAGSLAYIGQTGDAWLGGAALFAMSMGMGVPLLIVGSGAGSLPKAGGWMDTVKYIFGVVMLGMAIYILDRIIPEDYILILWALLLTIAPIALGATIHLAKDSSVWQRIYRGFLLIILGYGVLLMLLVARGGVESGGTLTSPLKGMFASTSAASVAAPKVEFVKVKNLEQLAAQLQTDKIVMLDFYADWCVYCKEYEKSVFPQTDVATKLAQFSLLKVDVTENNQDDQAVMSKFGVVAPPAILFFKNGQELRSKRIIGELNAEEFLAHINSIKTNSTTQQAKTTFIPTQQNNTEIINLKNQLKQQQQTSLNNSKKQDNLSSKLQQLTTKLQAREQQISQLTTAKQNDTKTIETLNISNQQLQNSLSDSDKLIKQLQAKLDKHNEIITKLQQKQEVSSVSLDETNDKYIQAKQYLLDKNTINKGLSLMQDLAEKYNFSAAQYEMARLYNAGIIVEQDKQKAYKFALQAVNNGSAKAMDLLVKITNGSAEF
jgi:thiol:disulfide interchange protein DsbD